MLFGEGCLVGVLDIVFVPLALYGFPIYGFAIGDCFGLDECLIVSLLLGMAETHGFDGGFVEYMDAATTDAVVKIIGAEGLSLYVEVGYAELEYSTQCVSHHLLLCAVARHLAAKQLGNDVNLALRELVSSHGVCC